MGALYYKSSHMLPKGVARKVMLLEGGGTSDTVSLK